MHKLKLNILPEVLAICRLQQDSPLPEWGTKGTFWSVLRSETELSIVCQQKFIPDEIQCEKGWRVLKVAGTMSFELTGVLASIVNPLADAGISIFAISSYDTDYVLVKEENINKAINILTSAGHEVKT